MTRKEVEQWYYAKAEITVDKEYNDAKLSHADVIEWLADFQQLLNKHDVVRSFFVLTHSGQFMDANMLQKGLYATDVPKLYSSETTIELMMQQGRTITDMAGNQFISEAYFQNLSKCKLTEVHLSVLE